MPTDRYSRQSFLGADSQTVIEKIRVGVVGLGGGGSHVVQQLAHVGFLKYALFDDQQIDESNLNRLVGAQATDVEKKTLKSDIARRMVFGLQPSADVHSPNTRWQECPEELRACDIIIGCVDSFQQRHELEACARRYMIPYVDLGMGVYLVPPQPHRMVGQVILSLPDNPCMWCLGFLNDQKLGMEADQYGDAGPAPQVVWVNGILASTAVGIIMDLVTHWSKSPKIKIHLSYDGNTNTISDDSRIGHRTVCDCPHYPLNQMGDPQFKRV